MPNLDLFFKLMKFNKKIRVIVLRGQPYFQYPKIMRKSIISITKLLYFYDTIQVKINMHHVLQMGILILMALLARLGNGDVLNLTVSMFKQARQQFQYLLVYFYDNNCQQCTKTTQLFYTFVTLAQTTTKPDDVQAFNSIKKQDIFYFHRNLQYSIIQASESQDIFKQESVDSVPEFRIYKKDSLKYYKFNMLGLTYQKLWMFASWVRRATESSIPKFQDISSLEGSVLKQYTNKSVIVDCKYLNLIQKIRKSADYMINLDIDYVCLKNSNLRNQNILLKQNTYNNKISYCDHNINQNDKDGVLPGWRNCENQIKNFRFRGSLVRWSDQLVNSIYNENRSVLVLLTNNESASWDYVRKLTELKNSFEERQQEQILPIFAIADLHYDLQGTIRLKKFIGGYDLKGWPYPYPILAYLYLEHDNLVVKYIYQQKYNNSIENSLSIGDWLRMAQQRQLSRDLRGLNCTPQIDLIDQKQQRTIYKIFLSQLLLMVDKHSKPNKVGQLNQIPAIFVFVLWRHSYEMQLLSSKMKKWWASIQLDAYFYILDLVENDLPEDIQINNLPALIIYFKNGKRQVWEGIRELKQVKNIVEKAFKK